MVSIKKVIAPIIIRFMYFKVADKQLFINRYTKKIPIANRAINKVEKITLSAQAKHQIRVAYDKWLRKNYPSKETIQKQKNSQKKLNHRPLISIIVPTYNTPSRLLKDCLESVLSQSYDNWELCIADDASTDENTKRVIDKYVEQDKRIKKVFRKNNGHICKASNSALDLAQGEYIALLDHDDFLWPNALYEVIKVVNDNPNADLIYTDEDKINETGKKHSNPFFKPDWSPEFLRSINYITHFSVIRKSLVDEVGGFRPGYEGAQDWDLFLRISRKTKNIYHIPTVLYSWRMTENSTAQAPSAKDYAYENQRKVLEDDIKRRGYEADLEWQIPYFTWKVKYRVKGNPLVSIIIPTKDSYQYVERSLKSINEKTAYKKYEVIIVDTGSQDKKAWDLYEEYKDLLPRLIVKKWSKEFNFSSVCDYGAEAAKGEYLLFLNNDTEVITASWLEDMLGYAQQPDIGAVGCKLYYPDGKLQHAGIILGVGGNEEFDAIAGHYFPAYLNNPPQSPLQANYIGGVRNFTAVTAACVMVKADKFQAVGGFDPEFKIAFNDVDLCLKLMKKGWRNVYLPHVELFHHESISVGKIGQKARDKELFKKEINLMLKKWKPLIDNDPYYHPEFRRDIANAQLKN